MGIPTIYPPFVMSEVNTRLAIPVQPLAQQEFELDVLGRDQTHLLTASLGAARGGARSVEIALHSVDKIVAIVTSELQILDGEGTIFGTISRDGGTMNHVLKDSSGTPCLVLSPRSEGGGMQMFSPPAKGEAERASVARRPASQRLPAEHYELVVSPGVDAVVPLACFLAMAVFVPLVSPPRHAVPGLQADKPGFERRGPASAVSLLGGGVQVERDSPQQPLPQPPPPPSLQGLPRRPQGAPGLPVSPGAAYRVSG